VTFVDLHCFSAELNTIFRAVFMMEQTVVVDVMLISENGYFQKKYADVLKALLKRVL